MCPFVLANNLELPSLHIQVPLGVRTPTNPNDPNYDPYAYDPYKGYDPYQVIIINMCIVVYAQMHMLYDNVVSWFLLLGYGPQIHVYQKPRQDSMAMLALQPYSKLGM